MHIHAEAYIRCVYTGFNEFAMEVSVEILFSLLFTNQPVLEASVIQVVEIQGQLNHELNG